MEKILEIKDLTINFPLKRKSLWAKRNVIHAVNGISFDVCRGETFGIIGESGCGKSSFARSLVGLNLITSGAAIFYPNEHQQYNLATIKAKQWATVHKQIQFIFQDPIAALNPRMNLRQLIAEPLEEFYPNLNKAAITKKILTIMNLVGLKHSDLNRYPQEFSGGQCQRIGIARALTLEPQILICDESISALDVSIKAQIINLLQDLQRQLKLTIIFISHDLSLIQHLCQRVLVMYLGNIMELGDTQEIYNNPQHPYTQALLSSILLPEIHTHDQLNANLLPGELPSPLAPPSGCVFNTRCPKVQLQCLSEKPFLRICGRVQKACHLL